MPCDLISISSNFAQQRCDAELVAPSFTNVFIPCRVCVCVCVVTPSFLQSTVQLAHMPSHRWLHTHTHTHTPHPHTSVKNNRDDGHVAAGILSILWAPLHPSSLLARHQHSLLVMLSIHTPPLRQHVLHQRVGPGSQQLPTVLRCLH